MVKSNLRNALLRALPDQSFANISSLLEPVDLPLRLKLAEPGRTPRWIYFPESGMASVVGQVGGQSQEIGVFGSDGLGCVNALLTRDAPAPYLVMMQLAGKGHRLPFADATCLFESDAMLRSMILRYVRAYLVQVSQSSIANCQFNTVQRMARWFLLVHDRTEGDSINLTHDFIATMLGVGRTGVTLALHALENAGLISTARKRITILDRAGLEIMTRSVYGFAEAEHRHLFGSQAES